MTVVSSVGYGIHCIDLSGRLHLGTARLLDTAATAVHEPDPGGRSEPDLVIRDLPDVTFLDAVGVAALHRAHDLVRGRAEVRIDHPGHPGPRSMLELATDHGWLAPAFRPGPVPAVTRIRAWSAGQHRAGVQPAGGDRGGGRGEAEVAGPAVTAQPPVRTAAVQPPPLVRQTAQPFVGHR